MVLSSPSFKHSAASLSSRRLYPLQASSRAPQACQAGAYPLQASSPAAKLLTPASLLCPFPIFISFPYLAFPFLALPFLALPCLIFWITSVCFLALETFVFHFVFYVSFPISFPVSFPFRSFSCLASPFP